jgi:CRP/FNR family transcriptional regulator, cyclic AMP receptor protein
MPIETSFLDEIHLFTKLDGEERTLLAAAMASRSLESRETLFRSGDPGDSMFIVQRGAIELYLQDTAGQKIHLHTAHTGEYFGELSLLDGGPRTATAAAVEDTELAVLDQQDLLQLFQKRPDSALVMLSAMGSMTRKANALLRQRVVRNVNEEVQDSSTFLQKVADGIAAFSGSMPFLLGNVAWFVVWIGCNTLPGLPHFDPYPFGLLTMIVSLEAIFLSCFVLISQNRQSAKDRVRADIEYEVNVRAELEIAHLHEKTDRIYEAMSERFARMERALGQGAKG